MINKTEKEEREYLSHISALLKTKYKRFKKELEENAKETIKTKKYLWENTAEMDGAEKAFTRTIINELISVGENSDSIQKGLKKLIASPYFARVDFKDEYGTLPVYIGIRGFQEDKGKNILIYDWRAPVSSVFYDYEKGEAHFQSPDGIRDGEVLVKRQYKIQNSHMEYMIESDVSIDDDILKKELSSTSDEKMKNIVATIQKEQNEVIRNEDASTLIIQGAAGSGKTSIALHRIAFMLYRFKNTIKSSDMLILSPNKVFGDYISNVLPELGEDNIQEMGFEEIAVETLGRKVKFQTFAEQVAELLEKEDEKLQERIRYKSSVSFLNQLDDYFKKLEETIFRPADVKLQGIILSKERIESYYQNLSSLPLYSRINKTATDMVKRMKNLFVEQEIKWKSNFTTEVKKQIFNMFRFKDTLSVYENFYKEIKKLDDYVVRAKNIYEYSDVFPLLYTKIFFESVEDYGYVKHLLVDEMQDYSPVQYAVLSKLFHCKMTILGDSNQSINPYSASTLEKIQMIFPQSQCVKLCKSYRSSIEITDFAQNISRNEDLVPIERHGEAPCVTECKSEKEEMKKIIKCIRDYEKTSFSTLGVICRTQKSADAIYKQLQKEKIDARLLDFNSTSFEEGIVVTNAHMAKGLEFDQVVIPGVSDTEYKTEMDRKMLYVACTRAMHKLDLFYYDKRSNFLPISTCAGNQT